jgi:Methylase involved in ubiquinone/menaquinone biosynthesis
MIGDSYNTARFTADTLILEKERLSESINIQKEEIVKCFQQLDIGRSETILDLGCGTGEISYMLALTNPSCSIIGMDRESKFVLENQGKFRDLDNLKFQEGDCFSLPFSDDSIDVCFCRYLFQHLRNPELALKEIYRVLKPGGKLGIFDIDKGLDIVFPVPQNHQKFIQAELMIKKLIKNDIYVGRKLFTLMNSSFFKNIKVLDVSINFQNTTRESLNKITKLWKKQGESGHIYTATKRITNQEIEEYFDSLINIAKSESSYINFGNLFVYGIKEND